MQHINPNTPADFPGALKKNRKSPNNWLLQKIRSETQDDPYFTEFIKDRIDGIPAEVSSKTLVNIQGIYQKTMAKK